MDIAIYQDALVGLEAFGQSIGTGLQSAVDLWTQGGAPSGDTTAGVEADTELTGLSSQLSSETDASLTTPEAETDNGLELGLETGVEADL